VWLWLGDDRRWVRILGVIAVIAVILQGILGGLRVTMMKDQIGIFHACVAQAFLGLLVFIALVTTKFWRSFPHRLVDSQKFSLIKTLAVGITVAIYVQLGLGATMRHQHAGLAISDFPLAHHQIWPAMDSASIARYNQERLEVMAANPITAFQVGLQMVHRITAVIIMAAVGWTLLATKRRLGWKAPLTKLALGWVGLIVGQAALGAATIWSNKAADIATAHVAVGALSLMIGVMIVFVARRSLEEVPAVRLAQAGMSAAPRGQDACPTTPRQESPA